MGFEVRSAVSTASSANNYMVEKAAAPSAEKKEMPESKESNGIASMQNYSVTSTENMRSEENQTGNSEGGNGKEPTEKEVKSKIDQANKELKHAKTGLDFKYHEATKRVSITVYDKDTKEVIREIPPEKSLDMLEKMWELAGMVVDDRR